MPDFSRLTSKHRKLLRLRSNGWSLKSSAFLLKERYGTVQQRQTEINRILGTNNFQEALKIWESHPDRNNSVLWDVVDTLRKEAKRASPISK